MPSFLPDHLSTPRLRLRAPTLGDAADLFAQYTQRLDVARFMTWRPQTALSETEAFIQGCIERWDSGAERAYLLERQDAPGRAIGMLTARPQRVGGLDLGDVLAPAQWGRGLMPEALVGLVDAVFRADDCWRVQSSCDIDNRASVCTLEKAGFVREGLLRRHAVHPNLDPAPRDCHLYARVR